MKHNKKIAIKNLHGIFICYLDVSDISGLIKHCEKEIKETEAELRALFKSNKEREE